MTETAAQQEHVRRYRRAYEILRWYDEAMETQPDRDDPDAFMVRFDRRVREFFAEERR